MTTELSQVNDLYLVSRTEKLQITDDYRTSQAELLRVHDEHRLTQKYLHEEHRVARSILQDENRVSQRALVQSKEENVLSQRVLLQASQQYQKEISDLATINYRDQSKLRAMNLALVADKQKLLLERSLLDGNDSVPGMIKPPFPHVFIALLTQTVGSVNRAQTWAKVVAKNPGLQDQEYPLLSPLAMIHNARITDLADTCFGKEPEMYQPSFICLNEFLTIEARDQHPGCVVWDTHARKNLEGHSPDITL